MNFKDMFIGFVIMVVLVGTIMACTVKKPLAATMKNMSVGNLADTMFSDSEIKQGVGGMRTAREAHTGLNGSTPSATASTGPSSTTKVAVPIVMVPVQKSDTFTDMDHFVRTIAFIESSGNDNAVGDKELRFPAYGCLQIRQPCADDAGEVLGCKIRAEDTLGNRRLSLEIFHAYMRKYATVSALSHVPTYEDLARIWNGGPNGWRRKSTEDYWARVVKESVRCK